MYAPCSCRCVATIDDYNKGRIFQSLDAVHTPNGLQYVTFQWFHDNNPIANVGDTFTQGDLIGHTGTQGNVTGDHTHMNMANGSFNPNNYWENGELVNSDHIYDICYTNNTIIVNGYGYNWIEYSGGVIPGEKTKGKFPGVLYARKLRNRHTFI